ncbi:YfcC family protein [Pseudomonas lactis]|uniref:YfcC family protein n=1 Tax=Pseudomonas lactis TaxID=1615674 RepID=A0A7Y1QAJ5_9PSED|nr:AbgT family transporter [Pseudomonas lactis]KRP80220.1 C4-dicarboxylate ABC transporter [Pseudomonas lactis]NNA73053.1 YfcC family protein [Pseudomonas lactis]NNA79418.1 YfcC family protein [Pseudomonas lactis]
MSESQSIPTQAAVGNTTQRKQINPAIILLSIVLLAVAFTYAVNSGTFQRQNGLVIPGSYQVLEKHDSLGQLFSLEPRKAGDTVARPVSLVEGFMAIPQGIEKRAALIFMVLFIGGMFGVLNKAGVIDAGLERMLGLTRGNIYVLVPCLMLVFSAGSTFMGLAKEFILIVPLMVAMANRLGLSNLIGLAIVTISVKIGYLASISNPVAQPMVGLPIFSGLSMRVLAYCSFLLVGIAFVLWSIRKHGYDATAQITFESTPLPLRHLINLIVLLTGIAFLVYASNRWGWKYHELSAFYLLLTLAFSVIAGLGASTAASAFVDGMKKVLIAGVLIGLATAVEIILSTGQVLDTIVNSLANLVGDHGPIVSAYGMFFAQLGLDVLIPSTSGQAAVTMPIFGPLGQLSGVSPQTTVFAFLMGNGLTNMITPTSSGLLVLLATANVGWGQWARYILPLFLIYAVLAMVLLAIAVTSGY